MCGNLTSRRLFGAMAGKKNGRSEKFFRFCIPTHAPAQTALPRAADQARQWVCGPRSKDLIPTAAANRQSPFPGESAPAESASDDRQDGLRGGRLSVVGARNPNGFSAVESDRSKQEELGQRGAFAAACRALDVLCKVLPRKSLRECAGFRRFVGAAATRGRPRRARQPLAKRPFAPSGRASRRAEGVVGNVATMRGTTSASSQRGRVVPRA